MKISLKLPNGVLLDFEGDAEDWARVEAFLAQPPDALSAPPMERPKSTEGDDGDGGGENGGGDDGGGDTVGGTGEGDPLSPPIIEERMNMVGARTDIERVTVLAQLAVEAGRPGIDAATADRIYTDLGYRKPSRFAKAFSNARSRNLIRNVSHGTWRTTYMGENFARGLGRAAREPQRRAGAQRPQLSLHAGGDDDA